MSRDGLVHCRIGGPTHTYADHFALWDALGAHGRTPRDWVTDNYDPPWWCDPRDRGVRVATVARTNARYTWSCYHNASKVHLLERAVIVWRYGQPVAFGAIAKCGHASCLAKWGDERPAGLAPCGTCRARRKRLDGAAVRSVGLPT